MGVVVGVFEGVCEDVLMSEVEGVGGCGGLHRVCSKAC